MVAPPHDGSATRVGPPGLGRHGRRYGGRPARVPHGRVRGAAPGRDRAADQRPWAGLRVLLRRGRPPVGQAGRRRGTVGSGMVAADRVRHLRRGLHRHRHGGQVRDQLVGVHRPGRSGDGAHAERVERPGRPQRRPGSSGPGVRVEALFDPGRDAARRPGGPDDRTHDRLVLGIRDRCRAHPHRDAGHPETVRTRGPEGRGRSCGHVDGLAHRRGGRLRTGELRRRVLGRLHREHRGGVRDGRRSGGSARRPRERGGIDEPARGRAIGRTGAEAANSIWSAGCSPWEPSASCCSAP